MVVESLKASFQIIGLVPKLTERFHHRLLELPNPMSVNQIKWHLDFKVSEFKFSLPTPSEVSDFLYSTNSLLCFLLIIDIEDSSPFPQIRKAMWRLLKRQQKTPSPLGIFVNMIRFESVTKEDLLNFLGINYVNRKIVFPVNLKSSESVYIALKAFLTTLADSSSFFEYTHLLTSKKRLAYASRDSILNIDNQDQEE